MEFSVLKRKRKKQGKVHFALEKMTKENTSVKVQKKSNWNDFPKVIFLWHFLKFKYYNRHIYGILILIEPGGSGKYFTWYIS